MKITQKHIDAARKAEAAKSAKVEETAKVEVKSEKTEKIIAAAAKLGKVWEKGGKVRIYLDATKAMEAAGWEITRYQSGAVMSAKKDGEKVSNSKAGKVSMALYGAYIDAVTGEVVCEDAEIRAAIEAVIAEALKPAEAEEAEAKEEKAEAMTFDEMLDKLVSEDYDARRVIGLTEGLRWTFDAEAAAIKTTCEDLPFRVVLKSWAAEAWSGKEEAPFGFDIEDEDDRKELREELAGVIEWWLAEEIKDREEARHGGNWADWAVDEAHDIVHGCYSDTVTLQDIDEAADYDADPEDDESEEE